MILYLTLIDCYILYTITQIHTFRQTYLPVPTYIHTDILDGFAGRTQSKEKAAEGGREGLKGRGVGGGRGGERDEGILSITTWVIPD